MNCAFGEPTAAVVLRGKLAQNIESLPQSAVGLALGWTRVPDPMSQDPIRAAILTSSEYV